MVLTDLLNQNEWKRFLSQTPAVTFAMVEEMGLVSVRVLSVVGEKVGIVRVVVMQQLGKLLGEKRLPSRI